MAVTYEVVQTYTATGSVSNIEFTSISGSYTDLRVIASTRATTGGGTWGLDLTINGDTSSSYSYTRMYGSGSSAGSDRASNIASGYTGNVTGGEMTANMFSDTEIDFMGYSNTSTYKTLICRNGTSLGTYAIVNLWRSTSAITSLKFATGSSSFAAGTTITLYGIKAA